MMDNIMVSVCCLTYNHEKYIRQCLDSFLNQKVNFQYEIIIHDDASTDRTQQILQEYQKRHPDIIRVIQEKENQYSQGKPVVEGMYLSAQGKYIAICEGDDYWSDPLKLQRQFDVMEKNPQCHFSVHQVTEVTDIGNSTGKQYAPEDLETGIIPQKRFLEMITSRYCFQTSSYFVIAEDLKEYCKESPSFSTIMDVGDEPKMLYFANCGDVYYLKESMSCRRIFSENSWSSRHRNLTPMQEYFRIEKRRMMMENYDIFTKYTFHEVCQKSIEHCLEGEFGILQSQNQYKMMLKPEYETLRKNWSFKYRILAWMGAFLPMDIKRKKNEEK